MDTAHIRIEELVYNTWGDSVARPLLDRIDSGRTRTRFLWRCIFFLSMPLHILIVLLLVTVGSFRLALANADKVIFVFATSILSFYQVPRKVFYIYIAVLAVTGLFQFLTSDSILRVLLLEGLDIITSNRGILFLRKFFGVHYSNPYTRNDTNTQTIFFPVGCTVPRYSNMWVFKFPNPPDLNFSKKEVVVGDCTITIETLRGPSSAALEQESSIVRSLRVEAPWGDKTVTFSMEDENVGRFVSYLEHVAAKKCTQVMCTNSSLYYDSCRALSIAETIEYFNRGLSLIKLERLAAPLNYNFSII